MGQCKRIALLAPLLLALLAPTAAQWSYEGYFNASTTPLAQSLAASSAVLHGLTLRVALLSIAQNNTFYPDNVTYGDGNAYLTGFASSTAIPALRAGDPDSSTCGPLGGPGYAVPVTWAQVDGAAVWVMKYVAQAANFSVQFEVVRLPGSVYYQSSKSDSLARALYTLDVLGYDAVIFSFFVTPDRMQWVRYLLPHQPYGYQVVTKQPVYVTESVLVRAFRWTKPFSPSMWGLLVASVVGSALLYYMFESNTGSDDFPLKNEPPYDKFARALFLSSMSSVLFEGFSPHTHEGRLYTVVKGCVVRRCFWVLGLAEPWRACRRFVFFVCMSCYIAQYAAILGEKTLPMQDVAGIESFAALNKPICVRQSAAQIAFLKTNYPNLQVQAVPGLTQAGMLPAIVSGQCVGGAGPDIEVKYGLGGPGIFDANGFDPTATFCGLTTVGEKLNFGYYGIPLQRHDTANINASVIDAMNVFVGQAINTGAYLNVSTLYFPDVANRGPCQPTYKALDEAASSSPVLEIADMAGLYILQAAGAALAMMVHAYRRRLVIKRAGARLAKVKGLGGGVTSRRIVKSDGTVVDAVIEPKDLPDELEGHALSFRLSASAAAAADSDSDYEGVEWGERTGMERRLTNLLTAQLAETRTSNSLLIAALNRHKEVAATERL